MPSSVLPPNVLWRTGSILREGNASGTFSVCVLVMYTPSSPPVLLFLMFVCSDVLTV